MARPIFNAGMFGVPTGLDMTGLKTPEMTPTIAAAASPRRRRGLSGMLGGVVNLANGVIDQDRQPNFLDFLLGGQNRVDAMRRAPYEQDALQFQRDQHAHERDSWEQDQDQQRQARERQAQIELIISQLPPDQQVYARLNPEAFVTGIMRNRYPAPQRGAASHAQVDPDAQLNALGGSWD